MKRKILLLAMTLALIFSFTACSIAEKTPEGEDQAAVPVTEETDQEETVSENTEEASENTEETSENTEEASENTEETSENDVSDGQTAFSMGQYYEDETWFQSVKSQNLVNMGVNFCFRADVMNGYRNIINLYVLVCNNSTYAFNENGENIGKNPNIEHVGMRNREFIRFQIKDAEFYFSDGSTSTEAPAVLWAPRMNDEQYKVDDDDLMSNLEFYNNGDSATLYCYSFRVDNGSYLFTRVATNVNNERYAEQAEQPYIFLCGNDITQSPFIEDGFSEDMLDSEYIRVENGEKVNVFMMFGPPDWCYMNFGAYQEFAAGVNGTE